MSAVMKYKVYEFGKDFNMSSTQVMDVIEKYFERPKNHMTALSDRELDMLFEYITKERGHENFDKYVEILNSEKKAQAAPQAPAAAQKGAPAQAGAAPAAPGVQNAAQARPASASAPPAPRKKKSGPRQIRGEVEKRIVDTKSVEVNLSKYDQKLEDLAPERAKDLGKQFQKLKKQPNRRGPRRRTETEAEKIRRLEAERAKRPQLSIVLPDEIVVFDLAAKLHGQAT